MAYLIQVIPYKQPREEVLLIAPFYRCTETLINLPKITQLFNWRSWGLSPDSAALLHLRSYTVHNSGCTLESLGELLNNIDTWASIPEILT